MASVTIVMSGDDARLRAAHERLLRDQEKALENYNKAFNKGKEAQAQAEKDIAARKAAAQAEKERLATIEKGQRLIEGQMTAQEQFNAKMAEAEALYKAGAIAESDLARRKETLTKKLQEESGAEKERQAVMDKGRKLIESQRTAQEKYNTSLAEAEELYKAGAIAESDLAKRKEFLVRQLREETGEAQKARQAEAQLTEAHRRAAEIVRSNETALEKYNRELAELRRLSAAGALSADQLARAEAKVAKEFKAAGAAGKTSLAEIAAGYISLQAGQSLLNSLASDFARIQQDSIEKSKQLARSQADALKNLEGLTFLQKQDLLTTTVDKISKDTGFPRRDLLNQAIGSGISAGGSVDEVVSAVTAAARINKQSPESLLETVSGAVDLARASGQRDAEKNLGFIQGVQAVSRVEDPKKLAIAIGKTVGNVAATVPEADREISTREGAALFAYLNKAANDLQGESTATASVQFAAYLRQFFATSGGQDDAAKKSLDEKISKLEADKAVTEKEAFSIRELEKKLASAGGDEKEKLQVRLNDVRAKATLTADEEKKLAELKKQQAEIASFKDPGTITGRIEALQANEQLRKDFLEKMPGEAVFKLPMESLLAQGGQAFKEFQDNFSKINYDPKPFTDLAAQMKNLSPQLGIADASATAEANVSRFDTDPANQARAEIASILQDTLPKVRAGGVSGLVQGAIGPVVAPIAEMMNRSPESFASFATETLTARRSGLEAGGITPFESTQIKLIDEQIAAISQIVQTLKQQESSAKINLEASQNMLKASENFNQQQPQPSQPPVSIAPAARDQAATANR